MCAAGFELAAQRRPGEGVDRRQIRERLRGVDDHVPFLLDATTLLAGDSFTFPTDLGDELGQ